MQTGSESFLYGQGQPKYGSNSREGLATRDGYGGTKSMGVYDHGQMQRATDEELGHGKPRGIWAALCCRG